MATRSTLTRPTASSGLADHCAELLSPLGPVRVKRMFGGHGFYVDDIFIALVAGDTFFLKVDAQTEGRFREAGCSPFVYETSEKRITMSYWAAPEEALESPALMQPWARLAMEAALRSRNAKPAARKTKTPARPRSSTTTKPEPKSGAPKPRPASAKRKAASKP